MENKEKSYYITEAYADPVMTAEELEAHQYDEETAGAFFAVPKDFLRKWTDEEGYTGGVEAFMDECTLDDCEALLASAIENDAFCFCYCPFREGNKFIFPKSASPDAMTALADFTMQLAYDHLFDKLVSSLPKAPKGYKPGNEVQPYTDGTLHIICQNEEHAKLVNILLASVGSFHPDNFHVTWFLPDTPNKDHFTNAFEAIRDSLPNVSELLPGYTVGQNDQMYTDGTYILCQSEKQVNAIADILDTLGYESVTGYFDPAKDVQSDHQDGLAGFWYLNIS